MNEHIDSAMLIDYLHGELQPEQDAAVLAHLAACTQCTAAYDAEAAITEAVRTEARLSERDLPPGVLARVRSEIDASASVPWLERLHAFFRPAVGLPAAAVVVLAAVLGFSSLGSHFASAPTIAASYYLDDHAALSTSSLPFAQTTAVPESLESASTGSGQHVAGALTENAIASE